MSKGSMAMAVIHGLVGPKLRLKSVSDGQRVNIPVPLTFCEGAWGMKRQTSNRIEVQITS